MRIDWWTLALQTVNVLVLIWLLARFFFRPVMDIVVKRQEEAKKLLADAARTRQEATDLRADADRARAQIAAERERLIAEARIAGAERRAESACTSVQEDRPAPRRSRGRDRARAGGGGRGRHRSRCRTLRRDSAAPAWNAFRTGKSSTHSSMRLAAKSAHCAPETSESLASAASDGTPSRGRDRPAPCRRGGAICSRCGQAGFRRRITTRVSLRSDHRQRDRASGPKHNRPQQLARRSRPNSPGVEP